MSDQSISIVPRMSDVPDRVRKAADILAWLVSVDIVQSVESDSVLGGEGGYAVSLGARSITTEPDLLPFGLTANGLEIVTERTIFDTGQNGLDSVLCPACQNEIVDEAMEGFDMWWENTEAGMVCPSCGQEHDIHAFTTSPRFGFSNLGFTFWNWPPFTDEFIQEFADRLGCEVDLVWMKL